MTRTQVTPWYIVPSPASTWTGVELVEADPAIVPTLLAAMEPRKTRSSWVSDADFATGYDALCKQGAALLMGAIEKLQMEVRAARGVDDLDDSIFDPEADPFFLSLGTVQDVRRELETANAKLEAIRLLLEQMGGSEQLDELVGLVGQAVVLLG